MTVRTLILLGMLACTAEAGAQQQSRSGFWLESGGGTGTIRVGCSTCEEPIALFGESAYLRIGGTLSRKVLIGLEVFALTDRTYRLSGGDSTIVVMNAVIAPVALWYPWGGGTFVKMGVGFAQSEIEAPLLEGSPAIINNGLGAGVTFGAGFDIPLRKWLALTVNAGVYYSALGDVVVNANPVDDVITTMYNANFAITIR